jgi:hypothetical protein
MAQGVGDAGAEAQSEHNSGAQGDGSRQEQRARQVGPGERGGEATGESEGRGDEQRRQRGDADTDAPEHLSPRSGSRCRGP